MNYAKGKSMDGKRIAVVYVGERENAYPCEDEVCVFENTFHGEYDIPWAVFKKDGEETRRYNLKMALGLEWLDVKED